MTTQGHRRFARRSVGRRRRPRFDGLEGRLVLSGLGAMDFEVMAPDIAGFVDGGGTTSLSPLAVIDATPGSGAIKARSLDSLTVTFDRPLDPSSIGFDDFRLVRQDDPSGFIATLAESLDASDPTGTRVVLTLGETLPVGRYQLLLSGWSFLSGADGASLAGGDDQILGTYEVVGSGPGLSGAIDLGTPSATPTVRTGHLDLVTDPDASDLYKITLPEGGPWNLQIDVLAQRDGGALDSVLTLLDSQGNPVASEDWGQPDAPLDPRLVKGVPGGTYYISVSGSSTEDVPDGSYRIRLVAEPIAAAPSVTGIKLDRANASSADPTGLTIRFSSPIDAAALARDQSQESDGARALVLVDGQGQTWPLIAVRVALDHTAVSFVFIRGLPSGTYRVTTGTGATLVDLTGRAPVAPGQEPGVLGTILVEEKAPLASTDLGTLWPSVGSKVGATLSLAPGESLSRTFTLLDRGYPYLTIAGEAEGLRFAVLDGSGSVVADAWVDGTTSTEAGGHRKSLALAAGTYTLVLTNDGGEPLCFALELLSATSAGASFLETGIGQAPANVPQLISPSVPIDDPGALLTAGPIFGNPTPAAVFPSAPETASAPESVSTSGARSVGSPGDPTGSVILVVGVPAGRPSPSFEAIGVVGPHTSTSTLALSSSLPGLPNGLLVVPESHPSSPGRSRSEVRDRPAAGEPASPAATLRPGSYEPTSDSSKAVAWDDRALADAGWLDRAMAWVADQFGGEGAPGLDPGATEPAPEAPVPGPSAPSDAPPDSTPTGTRIELASFTTPAVLVAAGLVAFRRRVDPRRRVQSPEGVATAPRGREATGESRLRFDPQCRPGARP